ncbi:MAG: protein-disulfide reductase DsbD family protein [Chitinophagales bacterium]
MMRILLFCLVSLITIGSSAQTPKPVKWAYSVKATGKGTYTITFTATMEPKWHTYSQFLAEGGPIPTSVTFDKENKDVTVNGKPTESGPKMHDGFDAIFGMSLKYYEEKMVIEQQLTVTKDTKVKVMVESMACDDHQCLPPETTTFEIELKK